MGSDRHDARGSRTRSTAVTWEPRMAAQPKIAIIGAGIGGLALAGFL